MEQVLLVVQLLLATALIGAVLLQRSDSDGFGLGSGSGNNFLSGRSSANLMTRTTAILAALFIMNSLALSIVASNRSGDSIVDVIVAPEKIEDPAVPAVPKVPVAGVPVKPVEKKADVKPPVPDSGGLTIEKSVDKKDTKPPFPDQDEDGNGTR